MCVKQYLGRVFGMRFISVLLVLAAFGALMIIFQTAANAGQPCCGANSGPVSNLNAHGGMGGAGGSSNASVGAVSQSQSVVVGGGGNDYGGFAAGAYAPPIAPTALCMGSTSGGAQGVGFGVSVGTSWTDQNCVLLEQVRVATTVLGQGDVGAEMMCAVDAYREARIRLGNPCKGTPTPAGVVESKPAYTDPYVRARLNLPPL